MLSRETLESYRRMTPGQRLGLTLQAMKEATPYLVYGPKEIVDRRFELLRRENDERIGNMLTRLAEAQRKADAERAAEASAKSNYLTGTS